MADREVELAKSEAKKRKRSGRAKSYMTALAQLAAENGHDDWASYAKALAAVPGPIPDFRVRLVGGGNERTITSSLRSVLAFHELDEARWTQVSPTERVQYILEFALSSRRERGDVATYTAEVIESNVLSVVVPDAGPSVVEAPAPGSANAGQADFLVEIESQASGRKEWIGVQLADLLEFHGIGPVEWESSGREEQESLIEETALWAKRSTGDLGVYFSQVVSGLEGEEEGGDAPR